MSISITGDVGRLNGIFIRSAILNNCYGHRSAESQHFNDILNSQQACQGQLFISFASTSRFWYIFSLIVWLYPAYTAFLTDVLGRSCSARICKWHLGNWKKHILLLYICSVMQKTLEASDYIFVLLHLQVNLNSTSVEFHVGAITVVDWQMEKCPWKLKLGMILDSSLTFEEWAMFCDLRSALADLKWPFTLSQIYFPSV